MAVSSATIQIPGSTANRSAIYCALNPRTSAKRARSGLMQLECYRTNGKQSMYTMNLYERNFHSLEATCSHFCLPTSKRLALQNAQPPNTIATAPPQAVSSGYIPTADPTMRGLNPIAHACTD